MSVELYVKLTVMVPLNNREEAMELFNEALDQTIRDSKPKRKKPAIRGNPNVMCKEVNCHRPSESRGMCARHYYYWHKKQPKDAEGKLILEEVSDD